MSLKKVTLKNFRTCQNIELADLGHLTVLMGRNGVGKTNILQGIEYLARLASNPLGNLSDSVGFFDSNDFNGELEFSIEKINYRYNIEHFIYSDKDEPQNINNFGLQEKLERQEVSGAWFSVLSRNWQTVFGKDGTKLLEINLSMPMMPAVVAMTPNSYTKDDIFPVLIYLRSIKYYSLNEIADYGFFVSRVDYLQWLAKSNESLPQSESAIMRLLHMYFDRKDDFDELNNLLGVDGLNVIKSIEILEVVMPNPKMNVEYDTHYLLQFKPGKGWDGVKMLPELNFIQLSTGTRRIIRILVSFFYDRNSLFLFEQPEDAIHSGLLRKLIDLLRGYDDKGQLIMTSHSSDLFNALKPEEVRLVTMERGATQVRALSEAEMAGAKRFINEEGTLSDYLDLLESD